MKWPENTDFVHYYPVAITKYSINFSPFGQNAYLSTAENACMFTHRRQQFMYELQLINSIAEASLRAQHVFEKRGILGVLVGFQAG